MGAAFIRASLTAGQRIYGGCGGEFAVIRSRHMTEERQGAPLIDGLVSVIMPVYNDTVYIRDAVQSVLR